MNRTGKVSNLKPKRSGYQHLLKQQAKKKGLVATGLAPSQRVKQSQAATVQSRDAGGGCCCNPVLITEAEINQPGGYVIGEPGLYKLVEDATYTPSGGIFGGGFLTGAINIFSDDVTLDLCDHTLKQVDASVSDVYGVQIGDGYNVLFAEEELASFSGQGVDAAEPYLGATVPVTIKGGEQVKVEFEKDSVWYGGVDACYFYLKNLTATNPATGPVAFPLASASAGTLPDNGSFEVEGLRFKVVSNSPAVPWSVEDLTASPPPEKLASDPAGTRVLRCGMEETYQGDGPGGSVTALDNNVTGIIISAVDGNPDREYTFDLEVRYSTETNYDFVRVVKNLLECRSFENITIQNGTIRDFSACGIFAYNGTFDFGCVPRQLYRDLHFSELSILRTGQAERDNFYYDGLAINLLGYPTDFFDTPRLATEADAAFKNVTIDHCNIDETNTNSIDFGSSAVFVEICDNLRISNTNANNTRNVGDGFVFTFGFDIIALNLQMWNCQANGSILTQGTSQVGGILLYRSQNAHIWECQFNDAFGENSNIVNNNISVNSNLLIERSQFNNYRGGQGAQEIWGLHGSDDPGESGQYSGYKLVDCQMNGHRVDDGNVPGGLKIIGGFFMLDVSNIEFVSCEAKDISSNNNVLHDVFGFVCVTSAGDTASPEVAAVNNIIFKNVTVSDIFGNSDVYGILTGTANDPHNNDTLNTKYDAYNVVIDNATVTRVHTTSATQKACGIHYGIFVFEDILTPIPYRLNNVTVKNSTVMDVRSAPGSLLSAGILIESANRPVLQNNTVNDCDRGILLTGSDDIKPNAFQVALTLEDATAPEPNPIVLSESPLYVVSTDKPGVGPFAAALADYSPPFVSASAVGLLANPNNGCSAVTNDLTGNIGIVFRGSCNFTNKTTNVEAAGAVGTIIVNDQPTPIFAPGGTPVVGAFPTVMISQADGNSLITALQNDPNIVVTIDVAPPQSFNNTTQGNVATVTNVGEKSFIFSEDNLTTLGWQSGDAVVYNPELGVPIPGLVPGQTYYAIVYRDGFSTRGLIQSNSVANCSVSGFQDDQTPCTSSAWVSNTGFCNGPEGKKSYDIKWGCRPPVARGNLSCYPRPRYHTENVAISCGQCDCKKQ